MGLVQAHALGRMRKCFAVDEVTPGTQVKATATDAFRVLDGGITWTAGLEPRADARDTASMQEMIERAGEVAWQFRTYLLTGLDPGDVRSDLHPLLYAGLGGFAAGAGVSDVYSLSDSQVLRTLSLYEEASEVLQRCSFGSVVNTIKISLAQGAEPLFEFAGPALSYAEVSGRTTISGGGATSATQAVTDTGPFQAGGIVQVGALTNTGAGYKINSVTDGASITLESSITTTGAEVVKAFLPTPTTVGTPIAGITGSVTINGTACPVTGFEVTLDNGIASLTEALAALPGDMRRGIRKVTGKLSIRARADLLTYLGARRRTTAKDLAVICGAAGNRITIDLPTVQLMRDSNVDLPQEDEGVFDLNFTALSPSSAAAEMTLTID